MAELRKFNPVIDGELPEDAFEVAGKVDVAAMEAAGAVVAAFTEDGCTISTLNPHATCEHGSPSLLKPAD